MIADLNKPRSSAMYTIYQEKVYVFGGYTGNKKRLNFMINKLINGLFIN